MIGAHNLQCSWAFSSTQKAQEGKFTHIADLVLNDYLQLTKTPITPDLAIFVLTDRQAGVQNQLLYPLHIYMYRVIKNLWCNLEQQLEADHYSDIEHSSIKPQLMTKICAWLHNFCLKHYQKPIQSPIGWTLHCCAVSQNLKRFLSYVHQKGSLLHPQLSSTNISLWPLIQISIQHYWLNGYNYCFVQIFNTIHHCHQAGQTTIYQKVMVKS